MIWNHTMPKKIGKNIHYYKFSLMYTIRYMKEAIFYIYTELSKRTDIQPSWWSELGEMRSYFDEELLQLEKELLCLPS